MDPVAVPAEAALRAFFFRVPDVADDFCPFAIVYDACRHRLEQRDRKYTGSTERSGLLGSRPSIFIFDAKQG